MVSIGRAGARKRRRLILRLSVDWVPPSLPPSGAGLGLGTRVSGSLCTPSRATPHRGRASADGGVHTFASRARPREALGRESDGALRGNRPQKGNQCPRDGQHHVLGMVPAGDAASRACAQPPLRPPTAIRDRRGELCQPAVELATPLGRIAVGPGPFHQCPARLGVARRGEAALTTTRPTGLV